MLGFTYPSEDSSYIKIFTKFMKNGSLDDLIRNKNKHTYNWETIKSINIFGFAAGIAYLHQHGFVLQKLIPSKIFLDEKFHPKIPVHSFSKNLRNDFDYFDDGDGYFKNRKKYSYYAPELLKLNDNIDPLKEFDVYTYSIILYQLLNNEKDIYNCTNSFQVINRVNSGKKPEISEEEIPQPYIEILKACWNSDPKYRPLSIQIVKKFIDHKVDYFDMISIDNEEFEQNIKLVTKDLNLDEN